MTDIKRHNGREEFDTILKSMRIVPSNTEIVEKTGVSKGSVSEIMNGKRTPTKKFIDKFIEGFNLEAKETKNPSQVVDDNLNFNEHYEKLISFYISLVNRLERELDFERSKNNKI